MQALLFLVMLYAWTVRVPQSSIAQNALTIIITKPERVYAQMSVSSRKKPTSKAIPNLLALKSKFRAIPAPVLVNRVQEPHRKIALSVCQLLIKQNISIK